MELCTWVEDKDINATPSETNPYRASREKLYLTAAGIRTHDLRFTSATLYQLSYKAKPGVGRGMVTCAFDISKSTSFLHGGIWYFDSISKSLSNPLISKQTVIYIYLPGMMTSRINNELIKDK